MKGQYKFKDGANITTGDFWYDLLEGGYIKPDEILENDADIIEVVGAMIVLKEFADACEEIMEVM